MKTKNDGGPIHPIPRHENHWGESVAQQDGMSLRDYFAASALKGYLASWPEDAGIKPDLAAKVCYEIADAMLKAREAA